MKINQKVKCDKCENEIRITQNKIKTKQIDDEVKEEYFVCNKCKTEYPIAYFNKETYENINKMKELEKQFYTQKITQAEYLNGFNNLKKRNMEIINEYKKKFMLNK